MEHSQATLEFETYLESIGGLVNGWYPDREAIKSRYFFSVGDGWLPMIKNLIEELIAVGWDKHITQVKEKFGSCRFYIASGSNEIFDIIEKYEDLSERTCEVCGDTETAEIRNTGWLRTLCTEHYKTYTNENS